MDAEVHRGRCFCGQVRFEVRGPARYVSCCHCESCRRATGAAYVPWVTVARAAFRVTAGTPRELRSAPGVVRTGCPRCGTALTYTHERRPREIDVTATSFEAPGAFAPQAHVWVAEKLPWVTLEDGLPQFAGLPE